MPSLGGKEVVSLVCSGVRGHGRRNSRRADAGRPCLAESSLAASSYEADWAAYKPIHCFASCVQQSPG